MFMKIISTFLLIVQALTSSFLQDNYSLTDINNQINAYKNKDEIINTKYVGKVSEYNWSEKDEFDINDTVIVKKEKNKDFVILSISDIHFADFDIVRNFQTCLAVRTIKNLVKNVKPDLIFVLGDNVCTESTVLSVQRFTDLMDSFNIPWAPIFGNHDDEGNCDLNYLADVMMTSPNCLLQKGDPEMGVGNYIINIAEETDGDKLNIVESFIMMYTRRSSVNEKQISWYKWVTDSINAYTNFGSEISLVEHIPIPEFDYAIQNSKVCEKTGKILYDENAYGQYHETVACERDISGNPIQRGFFDVIKESKTTKYVFVGHDHLNDYSVLYNGVRLTYNTKVGFSSGANFGQDGGTVITLNENGIKTITQKSHMLLYDFDSYSINTQ